MIHRSKLVFSLLLLGGASACANILGDFTKGDETSDGGGGDASPIDGSTADVMTGVDASSPGDGGGDGGSDAAGPPLLTCTQDMTLGSTVVVANFARQSSDVPNTIFFLGPTQNNQLAYVIVPGGNNQGGDAYRYNAGQTSPSVNDIPVPQGQIYDALRTADGVVVLSLDQSGGHSQLVVYKLSESVTDAGLPYWRRIPIGGLDSVPNNGCRTIATFAVVDIATDDYIAALSYNTSPDNCSSYDSPPLLFAVRTGMAPEGGASATLAQWPVPQVDGGTLQLDFARDSFIVDPISHKIYLVADPSAGGAPTLGIGPLVFSSSDKVPEGGATAQPMSLTATSYAGELAVEYSPSTGKANAAFLGGDLAFKAPSLFVGSAATGAFPTTPIGPATYKQTGTHFEALPVDKGAAHWHNFTNGNENVLMVGRNDLKGGNGVNLYWFDSAGNLRAVQAASDAGAQSALFQSRGVVGVDVTFGGTPGSFGDLLFAITEQTSADAGFNSFSLTQYHSNCLPQ